MNISTSTQDKFQSIEDLVIAKDDSIDVVKERLITKIDPVEMTGKPTIVMVPQDRAKRSAMLLSGTKFRLNRKAISLDHSTLNNNHIYSVSVSTHENYLINFLFSIDFRRSNLSINDIMETNFIVFLRFNRWMFIRYGYRVHMDSNVQTS